MSRSPVILTIAAVAILAASAAHADIEIHQQHSFEARSGATVVIDASFPRIEVTAGSGATVDAAVDLQIRGDGSSAKEIANQMNWTPGTPTCSNAR